MQGEEVCSQVMVPERKKQLILPRRSLMGDRTLGGSPGRKVRAFQAERKEGRKVTLQAEGTAFVEGY